MHRLTAAAIAAVLVSCASAPIAPDPHHPLQACVLSCPAGRILFEAQHLCSLGPRWFHDIWIIGEMRNEVGSWIGCDQPPGLDGKCEEVAYRKIDVEIGTCDQAIDKIVHERDPKRRGVMPGEDDHGRSKEPR